MIAELHRMGDIADPNVALRRGDDLARFDAAAPLNQFAAFGCGSSREGAVWSLQERGIRASTAGRRFARLALQASALLHQSTAAGRSARARAR
jgi:hypothetical protein